MSTVSALMRRRAALYAELATIDLEIADALAANEPPPTPPAKGRRPRLVAVAPPVPMAPANESAPVDRQRARADLARLGYRQR